MDFSHPFLIRARRIGRRLGILAPLWRLLTRRRRLGYEDDFRQAIMSRVQRGDVVWDVGANVGHYTKVLAGIVGPSGRVVAFEPSPRTFEKLSLDVRAGNVKLVNAALSNAKGSAGFYIGDEFNPTDSLTSVGFNGSTQVVQIEVTTGDDYAAVHPALSPVSIKIDVEGFEYEVLCGMRVLLESPTLKSLFIEVHFDILEARGQAMYPRRIKDILQANGFTIRWTDPSHICAVR